jgi:two-component system OmpR family sensor kinase
MRPAVRIPWKWLAALLPAAAGIVVAGMVAAGTLINHRIYLAGGIGTLSWVIGLILSSILIIGIAVRERTLGRHRQEISRVQSDAAEDRRRFLRRLDHELKNPLTAIRAGLVNLAGNSSEENRQAAISTIETQALRLSRLAADLRKLAELETRPLERTPVEMGALLREVLDVIRERPEARQRRLNLSVPQAPWPLPSVNGDYDLLFLAVHNLLDNALKFTQPGDTVEVRGFEDATAVVIEVADTGPGVPDDEISQIWDELYRGQGARGIPGSGLGLALVRAIAERHGGQVSLRSRAGQGTVFTLRLPLE